MIGEKRKSKRVERILVTPSRPRQKLPKIEKVTPEQNQTTNQNKDSVKNLAKSSNNIPFKW